MQHALLQRTNVGSLQQQQRPAGGAGCQPAAAAPLPARLLLPPTGRRSCSLHASRIGSSNVQADLAATTSSSGEEVTATSSELESSSEAAPPPPPPPAARQRARQQQQQPQQQQLSQQQSRQQRDLEARQQQQRQLEAQLKKAQAAREAQAARQAEAQAARLAREQARAQKTAARAGAGAAASNAAAVTSPLASSSFAALPAAAGEVAAAAWAAATEPPPADGRHQQLLGTAPGLPARDHGVLVGGQYPYAFDPVYGLPIVRDVVTYGQVLRDVRQGAVSEVLWFFDTSLQDPFAGDGRCLLRYRDGRVAQSVVPAADPRLSYAMAAHGVRATKLPLEPRHIPAYAAAAAASGGGAGGLAGTDQPGALDAATRGLPLFEVDDIGSRRGPRLAPSYAEAVAALPDDVRADFLQQQQDDHERAFGQLQRCDEESWARWKGIALPGSSADARREGGGGAAAARAAQPAKKQSWSDKIIISQDMQVLIYKWVPIIGPVLGSAFVIGLYVAARLLRGDLTDRMKLMDEGEEKRRRTALREARIAFLEEEVPALVARRADMSLIRKKLDDVNKKLGSKFEISEAELMSTVDACGALLAEGQELDAGEGATQAAERILAAEEAEASRTAQQEAEGGAAAAPSGADALMEMGKLNTARVRKAIDPRILDVKKRVRAARRSLKRESKVVLSDEIIFFDDVAGNEQAKVELMEVVDFFRKPEKFRASGARPPKGVLLVGPPGNGKTLMARAVAGESGVAFISSSASEFIEMYMGLGAARVRDLFATARKLSPCIIFIDELDAVGRARRSGQQGGNDERDNTVNQLLTELDGFAAETQGIVVMGATNRKDVLDPALTRPGRFDRSIEVTRPDYQGRLEGMMVHLREKPIAADIDYAALASLTGGMSGAQLAGVCNTACFLASRKGRTEVTQADLVAAVEQAKYGRVYEAGRFISPGRKRRFAVVEAGFCTAAALLPAIEPIDYVTILPSIKSPVGRTVLKPNVGRYTTGVWTRAYLEQQLRLVLAGRAAEELVFGRDELSSLHQAKIMLAREIVHKMLHAGMSRHPNFENLRGLGTTYIDPSMEPNRYTSYITQTDSDQTRSEWVDTDMEMEALLNGAYDDVKALLARNRAALDALAAALLEAEHMQGDAVYAVLDANLSEADRAARAQEAPAFI